jgi:hypothetical protein
MQLYESLCVRTGAMGLSLPLRSLGQSYILWLLIDMRDVGWRVFTPKTARLGSSGISRRWGRVPDRAVTLAGSGAVLETAPGLSPAPPGSLLRIASARIRSRTPRGFRVFRRSLVRGCRGLCGQSPGAPPAISRPFPQRGSRRCRTSRAG